MGACHARETRKNRTQACQPEHPSWRVNDSKYSVQSHQHTDTCAPVGLSPPALNLVHWAAGAAVLEGRGARCSSTPTGDPSWSSGNHDKILRIFPQSIGTGGSMSWVLTRRLTTTTSNAYSSVILLFTTLKRFFKNPLF